MEKKHSQSLDSLRMQINSLDEALLELLHQRSHLVRQIALVKQHEKIELYQPEREKEILARLKKQTRQYEPKDLTEDAIDRIFRAIIQEMRELQVNINP